MTGIVLFAVALAGPLFYNVAPYSPGRESVVAADMRDYVSRTGNRMVLYSLTLHPEGRPAMEKVEQSLASYRRLKKELEGSDVELGVLLQSIVGHWPRADKEVEPWQRTVNAEGEDVRFCWLDGEYRNYIRTVASLLATENPCFILADDDIRAFSPHAECFCPLHVKEFNRRRGTAYTSKQMRVSVRIAEPGSPDFETFMALQREQVNGIAALIREGIDRVDPKIPAGTCMPTWECRFNDQASRAIAARGQMSVMRLGNGYYHDWRTGLPGFAEIAQRTQALFAYHHDKVAAIISEADTYPHHLWSRSSTGWHAHLVMSLFIGLKGAKLWFVNAHVGEQAVNRNYTERLAESAGLYRTLVREMAGAECLGLIEPCLTRFSEWHPLRNTREAFTERDTWSVKALGRMGIPTTVSRDYSREGVWTLSGEESVSRLSDSDLRQIFSHSVLVDGIAAVALTRRGLAGLTGARASLKPLLFNGERNAATGSKYRLYASDRVPELELLNGARRLTSLVYCPYDGSPADKVEEVAPGASLFINELGGKVVVTAFHMGVSIDQICNEARQDWLFGILDLLAGDRRIPCVANRQDVLALSSRTQKGDVLLAVFNLNCDPLKTVDLRVKGSPSVSVLGEDGEWCQVRTTCSNAVLRVCRSIPCCGTSVFRLNMQ